MRALPHSNALRPLGSASSTLTRLRHRSQGL